MGKYGLAQAAGFFWRDPLTINLRYKGRGCLLIPTPPPPMVSTVAGYPTNRFTSLYLSIKLFDVFF